MQNSFLDVPTPSCASSSPIPKCPPVEKVNETEKINSSLSISNHPRQNSDQDPSNSHSSDSNNDSNRNKTNIKRALPLNSSSNSSSFKLNNQMLSSAIRSSSRNNLPLTSKKMSLPLGKHCATPPRKNTNLTSLYDSSSQYSSNSSIDISEINSNSKLQDVSNNDIAISTPTLFLQTDNTYVLANDPNSAVFEQKENNIITQINEISKSIEELLKQRKEIQFQHKRWLDDRKKKIFQVRKETNQMQNDGKSISANMLLFPIITLVGPTNNTIQQS
ncbi:hypothetical protein M9Y10_029019 [Tritrichomonas musculus]|uniref:Uncharacterized protein n=1 Tax=Tritrichomonas musculus TaxID=1915356 RepID=A0ABR2KL14_9EUKA